MGQNTEAIEENIKRIQERMSEKVEHLSEDLSLSSFASRTLGARSDTPGDLFDAAVDTVKQHPIPAALIGAGLIGLFASQRTPGNNANGVTAATPSDNSYQHPAPVAQTAPQPADRVASHVDTLKTEAEHLKASAGEKLENARAVVGEKAGQVKQIYADARSGAEAGSAQLKEQARQVGDTLSATGETLKRRAENVPGQMRDTSSKAVDWAKENPVPLGLMALAIGAAAATVLTTRKPASSAAQDPLPQSDTSLHHIPADASESELEQSAEGKRPVYTPPSPVPSSSPAPKPRAPKSRAPKSRAKSGTTAKKATSATKQKATAARKSKANAAGTKAGKPGSTAPGSNATQSASAANNEAADTRPGTVSRAGPVSKS